MATDHQAGGPDGTSGAVRRARREFVRAHHPDRGGDPVAFAVGLARFDARLGGPDLRDIQPRNYMAAAASGPGPCRPVTVLRRPRGLNGWARHLSRLVLTVGGRKPGQLPRVH